MRCLLDLANLVLECHENVILYCLAYHGTHAVHILKTYKNLYHYIHAYGQNTGHITKPLMLINLNTALKNKYIIVMLMATEDI